MIYNSGFPLELFQGKNIDMVEHTIRVGKDIAANRSVSFVGIAKDSAPWIERNLELALVTGQQFKGWSGYVYENDSTDETVNLLEEFRSQYSSNFSYDSDKRPDLEYARDHSDPYHYIRASKLADARNRYADKPYNTDYICVVDWDIKGGWWVDGFFHSIALLQYVPNAGCMSAYGVLGSPCGEKRLESCDPKYRLMYDSFAYRDINANTVYNIKDVHKYNHIKCNVGEEPMPVKSNFGGISVYKREAFEGLRYSVVHHKPYDGAVDCDHVVMNRQIIDRGYGVYMNPSFLSSHSPHRYTHGT